MLGVLEITFSAFYPRKQHCNVAKLVLSIIRLYDRGHVHITLAAVTSVGRGASDPLPHLGWGCAETQSSIRSRWDGFGSMRETRI